jgi:hypothetical protein
MGSRIWFSKCALSLITMKLDASGTIAWGYHISDCEEMCAWTKDQLPKSIQFKELYSVVRKARRYGHLFTNRILRAGIDNTGMVYMINKGSSCDPDRMLLLHELAELQALHQFDVVASWVPQEFNVRSDLLSRLQGGQMAAAARAKDQYWTPCRRASRRRRSGG